MTRVIVIGGGLAGMAGAVSLADAGMDVSLYERRSILGGRASSFLHPTGGELVDNCQHVLLRCCTNLIHFYEKLGVERGIIFQDCIPFIDELNRLSLIQKSSLPVPLHLAPSFFRFKALGFKDKLAIGYAMMRMLLEMKRLNKNGSRSKTQQPQSMLHWLRAHRQTDRTIEAFWRPILISALNDELDDITADYGILTIVKAFLLNKQGYEVGLPTVPLRDLYEPCTHFLEDRNGIVYSGCGISEISMKNGAVSSLTLSDGTVVEGDVYLSAVPFDVLLKLLPENEITSMPYFENLRRLDVSPITAVHVWFDRQVTDLDYAAVLGRTVQWVFNQSIRDDSETSTSGTYLGLVVSASDDLMKMPQQEIIAQAMADLVSLFPKVKEAELIKAIVVKEGRATFAPKPGCDALRPTVRSPIPNLFVAGDWTQTGWPATMEGAVRSGYQSAEAVLDYMGSSQSILQPDMPTDRLMKWVVAEGRE